MEAKVDNYLFKLDRMAGLIEVYGESALKPHAFIRAKADLSEKEFHTEISYWIMNNKEF